MGHGVAQAVAQAGYEVTAIEIKPDVLEKAYIRLKYT
jgi:3-hydroxyacyl-CoA dehydrogenase